MEFALRDGIEAFVLVSSDSDLSHIAHALRELNRHVLGLGEEKAPERFLRACSRYEILKPAAVQVPDADLEPVDRLVRDVLGEQDPNRRGLLVPRLNELVRKADQFIKISELKEKTWPN